MGAGRKLIIVLKIFTNAHDSLEITMKLFYYFTMPYVRDRYAHS